MQTHLIFDLGGTLLFDPFDEALVRLSSPPLREKLERCLSTTAIDDFMARWRIENRCFNYPFASHFLQEEPWITRAARAAFEDGKILDKGRFPIWVSEILSAYREVALDIIRTQSHLSELRDALEAAKRRNYQLSVASNDRYFAASAMLAAAGIAHLFDFVVTSEGLSFTTPGAEKPSDAFFRALEEYADLQFAATNTLYIGDDETRDIKSVSALPLRTVRFFGNRSHSRAWLDNSDTTDAEFSFERYSQLKNLIESAALERKMR